jgi:hypothetical protein
LTGSAEDEEIDWMRRLIEWLIGCLWWMNRQDSFGELWSGRNKDRNKRKYSMGMGSILT